MPQASLDMRGLGRGAVGEVYGGCMRFDQVDLLDRAAGIIAQRGGDLDRDHELPVIQIAFQLRDRLVFGRGMISAVSCHHSGWRIGKNTVLDDCQTGAAFLLCDTGNDPFQTNLSCLMDHLVDQVDTCA
ncbi:MAG: hypothetical protein MZV65_42115 [Chromatiales bacterium]|nr:hypothetical protein [Chromatiales bacterium]